MRLYIFKCVQHLVSLLVLFVSLTQQQWETWFLKAAEDEEYIHDKYLDLASLRGCRRTTHTGGAMISACET